MTFENALIIIPKGNSYYRSKSSAREPQFKVLSEGLTTEIDIFDTNMFTHPSTNRGRCCLTPLYQAVGHSSMPITIDLFACSENPEFPTQPQMMSFKKFLVQQEDSISEEDAIKKYNDYKLDFKKQQISEFFVSHKEEEW